MLYNNNVELGRRFESAACEWLKKSGINVIERNFTVKGGEIDIIAEDGDTLAFIEVKARQESNVSRFGRPGAAVNQEKRENLIFTANEYQRKNKITNKRMRFDVLEIYYSEFEELICLEFKYYKSAFTK
ncbi:MAG: YraN family protein [Clostridia bacterium]|nr:YraN family protein [Clostridia bacterium]